MPRRLKLLVAVHLFISTAQAAMFLVPAHVNYLPAMWAIGSLAIAQLILLSFWAGMGSQRAALRFPAAVLGSVYMAALPIGAVWGLGPSSMSQTDLGEEFVGNAGPYCALVMFFAAMASAARRWLVDLRLTSDAEQTVQPRHYQFSILHLLVLTSVAAIVLALKRATRADAAGSPTGWQSAADEVLMIVAFVINAVCAAWAALAVGPVRMRVGLVLLVAALLGATLAFSGTGESLFWWHAPAFAVFLALPSAIIIASLLVVRSCGYRLVARTKAAS
ncbi:MAG TPA: hypothetical protein VFW87_26980 [Pirellulales bacterium]|nr:hypothetical protein [Pirellulales bacterium]